MTQLKHIIKRQVIEVKVDKHLNDADIHNRVAKLFNEKIIHIIDECLTEKSLLGYNGKIEHLELDLGIVDINNLENSFIQKVEFKLRDRLLKIMAAPDLVNEKEVSSDNDSNLDLVVYYLRTGSFPWWAPTTAQNILDKAWADVFIKNAAVAGKVLADLLKNGRVLKRFIYTFNDSILEEFASVFLPDRAALQALQKEMLSLDSDGTNGELKESFWFCLIGLLVSEAKFNGKYTPEKVLTSFANLFSSNKSGYSGFKMVANNPEITGLLNRLFNLELSVFPSEDFDKAEKALTEIELLLSGIIDEKRVEKTSFQNECMGLKKYVSSAANYFASLRTGGWIGTNSIDTDFIELKSHLAGISLELSKLLNSQSTANDTNYLQGLQKHVEPVKIIIKTIRESSLRGNQDSKEILSSRLTLKDLAERRVWQIEADSKVTDPFSQSDKIYIQNAGLVLLWPFLNSFFQNMGLVSNKTFIDENARQKACLILQYLAGEANENVFEAHLPLNKVLCGVDMQQTVNTQWALTDEEKGDCGNFMNAVIDNAPLWKNLSAESFRKAYLQREGALGTRDGNWLLQVKRETYDVMIDKLPWPVQVVKLPWMKNLIFVEWQIMQAESI